LADRDEERREGHGPGPEAVGDALRSAVERTLAATAESASGTRDRAQVLFDDVVRRGQSAGQRVARGSESATARLAEAIGELRAADSEGVQRLADRLDAVERRLDALEAGPGPAAPEPVPPGSDEGGSPGPGR